MYEQNFQSTFYAFNAYYNYYKNKDTVYTEQYASLTIDASTQYDTLYSDPIFGMSSVRSMNWWVQATQGGPTSAAYLSIVQYFSDEQGLLLTSDDMNQLTGTSSKL
jgi:hypothetical protein